MSQPLRNTVARLALPLATLAIAGIGPAEARFVCRDGYQLVAGSWLSTPYCRDAQLADVARQYGFRASAVAIRENPNFKREICRFVISDIRVRDTCLEVGPYDHGGRF